MISSTRTEKEERQEKPAEAAAQKTVKTSVDSESVQSVIIAGFDLNSLSKKQLLNLIKEWVEETEEIATSEENEADCENLSEITIGQQTSIDARIVYDERSKRKDGTQKAMINSSTPPVEKNLTAAMAAAGEVQEESNEQEE